MAKRISHVLDNYISIKTIKKIKKVFSEVSKRITKPLNKQNR